MRTRDRRRKVRRILSDEVRRHVGRVGPFDRVRVWWDGMMMHVSVTPGRVNLIPASGGLFWYGPGGQHSAWIPGHMPEVTEPRSVPEALAVCFGEAP